MSESDLVGYPSVDASITAAWPGASALTSSPKSGVLLVKEPAFAMGGGAESRLRARKTRPVIGPSCAEAGNEISKRGGATLAPTGTRARRVGEMDVPGATPKTTRARERLRLRMTSGLRSEGRRKHSAWPGRARRSRLSGAAPR